MIIVLMSITYQPYRHDPLEDASKQIRLIKVNPNPEVDCSNTGPSQANVTNTHLLSVQLQTFDLDSAPEYTAISYEWGTAGDLAKIQIGDFVLRIRKNLFDFLWTFQVYGDTKKYLWIDQISIDQASKREKSQQVAKMGRIYDDAQDVLIWLGNHDNPHVAFDAVEIIARDVNVYGVTPTAKYGKRALSELLSSTQCHELDELSKLSYWGRHWIVQEAGRGGPSTLMYGSSFLPFDHLALCAQHPELSKSWGSRLDRHLASLLGVRANLHKDGLPARFATKTSRWLSLMRISETSKCADPRDKVFGIRSLQLDMSQIEVDYDRSVWEVFSAACQSYAQDVDDASFLYDGLTSLAIGMELMEPSYIGKRASFQPFFNERLGDEWRITAAPQQIVSTIIEEVKSNGL